MQLKTSLLPISLSLAIFSNGSSIQFESNLGIPEPYIRLTYKNTNTYSGEVTNQDYKIYLITIPSNLGKGNILYFLCPVTGRRCRIFYKCYGSLIWKSRLAYHHRIYYHSQVCSKYDYHNIRYWDISRRLDVLNKKVVKNNYKGEPIRLLKTIKTLEAEQQFHDMMRWLVVPKAIQKMVNGMGLSSAEYLF